MNYPEHLGKWLKGNQSAVEFVLDLFRIVELWDDLVDNDNEITPKDVNKAFHAALITLPRNGFYHANFTLLNPIIEAGIFDWHTANHFEKKKENLETAFGLRCTLQSTIVLSARIVGGDEWAQTVSHEIRSLGETWAEYAYGFGVK
jgi:hypothetical protein